jgi:GMP synthase (glutamine-hydrolysing) A subunit
MQKIIILDFGSQTTQLIGRRVRELDTFCEILPYNKFPTVEADLQSGSIIGVILSGSPYSVHDPEAFKVDLAQFVGKVPVLGICYGAQLISHTMGGKVEKADSREYGRANLQEVDTTSPLFRGFEQHSQVWMSHGDTITAIPDGFHCIASTKDVKYAAFSLTPGPSPIGEGSIYTMRQQQGKSLSTPLSNRRGAGGEAGGAGVAGGSVGSSPIVVDLHASELLDTTAGMTASDILNYQLDVFRRTLKNYEKKKGTKIVFIHGKGEGVLRKALVNELQYRYKSYIYQDASFQEYGYGATQVTIK